MERTESIVVQVAPSYENERITEMEKFGWNLQGRQEIHEMGNAYVRPEGDTYVIKQQVSHYVKLHFIRSLNLPNLDEIKRIESEYFNLPFPPSPSQTWPIGCIGVSLLLTMCTACSGIGLLLFGMSENRNSITEMMPIAIFLVSGMLPGLAGLVPGIFWYRSNSKKKEIALQICQQSAEKVRELMTLVKPLVV